MTSQALDPRGAGALLPRAPVDAPAAAGEVLQHLGRRRLGGWRRVVVIAGVVVALAAVVAGFIVWRVVAGREVAVAYATVKVARGDLASTVVATGSLAGRDTVDVGAEVSGKIKALHADFNGLVTRGQVLGEIDPEQLTAARNQSKAQLVAARADLKSRRASADEARLAAARLQRMANEGLSSTQSVEAAVAAAARADAAVEAGAAQITVAEAALLSMETSLAKTIVRSPIDGVVLSRKVEVGQTVVAAMTTPVLFTLARDLKEMELTVAVDEADVGQVRAGQSAIFSVDAHAGRTFPTTVREIHNVPVLRDNVVTYEALLSVTNDELLLRPGMTATVTIETERRTAVLLVPDKALRFAPVHNDTGRTMFSGPREPAAVVDIDRRPSLYLLRLALPVRVRVTTGLSDGTQTEILCPKDVACPVVEGDLVIVDTAENAGPKT